VYLPIFTGGGCAKSRYSLRRLNRLTLTLSATVKIRVRLKPFWLQGSCGASVGKFAVQIVRTTSPLSKLVVTRSFPRSIVANSTVSYTVTFTNPTETAISLQPCPRYMQFLEPLGTRPSLKPVSETLPCAAITSIPAGGAASFQIQEAVPDRTGRAKYSWRIPRTSLATGGATTIVK
jgi:hypothetical protein